MASLSNAGFNLLKGFEGFKTKPYHLKGEKYYTVGLGHYGPDVNPNKIYTEEECMALFAQDKIRFENDVNKVWHEPMTQQMFDALFSMAYNHGNVSKTVLANACAGNGWQDKTRISNIWRNLYTCKGLLSARRAKEVAYFYGDTDPGGSYSAGGSVGYSAGGSYSGNYSSGGYSGASDYDITKDPTRNGFTTYTSVYGGASLNMTQTASLSLEPIDSSTSVQHTRIYKYVDSSVGIVLDELSIPLNEGDVSMVDSSTNTNANV